METLPRVRTTARPSRRDDLVPYGAIVAAVLAIVFLLPSALRPPDSPPSETAELSPDAPPDENQDSIISTVNRGQSGTGDGQAEQGDAGPQGSTIEIAAATTMPPPPPARPPAACPYGYGQPPRQTFSIYSPPCAGAFNEDNGGATSNGVFPTEIRVVVPSGTEGFVTDDVPLDERADDRTWRVLQTWFNSRYQLYGRKLRFYKMGLGGNPEERKAAAAKIADEVKAFAVVGSGPEIGVELARRKVVYFGEVVDQWDEEFSTSHRPYLWTWHANATLMRRFTGEYVCGRLANRPASHAGAPYQGETRKFGVIYADAEGRRRAGEDLKGFIEERCGQQVYEVISVTEGAGTASSLSTAVARFRQAGVTSVLVPLHFLLVSALTNAAKSQGYFPEWIITGEGLNDLNVQGKTMDQASWAGHAFGISALEIEEAQGTSSFGDGFRAYKEIDPGGSPSGAVGVWFYPLQMLVNGLQLAGPNLTPETLERGLFNQPRREGPPTWAAAGGYAPRNYGFATQVGEIWWDPGASDSTGQPGAYRWTRGGQRWRLGELPPGDTTVFTEGTATRPADWVNSY